MCQMRKIQVLLVLLVIVGGVGVFVFFRGGGAADSDVRPEVFGVGRSAVMIGWVSEAAYKGRVYYQAAGSEGRALSAAEDFGGTKEHVVAIGGLSPSTRYTYRIGDSESRFQFQTQPAASGAFSFLMVWGDLSGRMLELVTAEMPEFIVSVGGEAKGEDQFSQVRSFVPVYGPGGVDSDFLRGIGAGTKTDEAGGWRLDWGGLGLVFAGDAEGAGSMLNAPGAHTLGVIVQPEAAGSSGINEEALRESGLHSILVVHNKENASRPAAFVGVVGRAGAAEIDSVQYFGIGAAGSGAVRVDVDVESARAYFIDEGREVVLKAPPLKQRRTCEQCRRLADKGAYEASIKAYEEFIETHQGHFQIDDAYYAIAEIYDEKLFLFGEALAWYGRLVAEYPEGTLTPLAKQRVKYLSEYDEYDFGPLAAFERIRKVEFARQKDNARERERLLGEVRAIIKKFPESKLAPRMLYWVANQYGGIDVDKAVSTYRELKERYPQHPESQEVLMEVGRSYYEAARYREAKAAYEEALVEFPGLGDTIKAQIARSRRNIRRGHVAVICWIVFGLVTAAALSLRPAGVGIPGIVSAGVVFLVLAILLGFMAWLIREQFLSGGEMVLIVICLSCAGTLASLLSGGFAGKVTGSDRAGAGKGARILSAVVGSAVGLVLLATGMYLSIYYINEHYLIVVGM